MIIRTFIVCASALLFAGAAHAEQKRMKFHDWSAECSPAAEVCTAQVAMLEPWAPADKTANLRLTVDDETGEPMISLVMPRPIEEVSLTVEVHLKKAVPVYVSTGPTPLKLLESGDVARNEYIIASGPEARAMLPLLRRGVTLVAAAKGADGEAEEMVFSLMGLGATVRWFEREIANHIADAPVFNG